MGSKKVPLGPFTYTATGDLGEQRDPMLCNEMHLRDRVGQAKVRGHYIPGKGFTYGRPNERRDYTALDALRGYAGSFQARDKKPKIQMGRDFLTLNRAAVSAGLVTTKEHSDYRTTHDFRLKPPPDVRRRVSMKFPANMVFGLPPRPSTPMFDLLEHRYKDNWIYQHYKDALAKKEKQSKKKSQLFRYDTRAAMLRTFQNPVETINPPWQLPRFVNNGVSHLQTFRSYKDKDASKEYVKLDSISRKGTLGQGVYEGAKN